MTVTIENLTEDTVTFGDVGYQLNPVERPIAELNRDYLPPHVFLPLMALSAEYLPGESRSALLSNVTPDMYIITYATTTFTGASAGNPYNEFGIGTGGEWAQAAVATQVSPVIPAASTSGLVILAVLLAIGGVAAFRRKGRSAAVASALLAGLFLIAPAYAWERGNHAGDWGKGATLKVCVDTPPGTPEQQAEFYEAVFEAIAEWNEAQAAFGGLTLEYTPSKNNCDVRIHWQANAPEWGSTAPGGPPVDVTIESNDGLNSRGVTRVLKHEFGHVEGLGHSANSDLMREDAYSSTPGTAPSADDLNSADPFTEPTADDLAGKKEMYGTVVEQSKSQTTSNATYNGALDIWQYIYELFALMGPTFVDPVTEFTIDLPPGVGPADFTVTQLPPGWVWEFHDGGVSGSGKQLDREEAHSPSLLRFKAPSPALGIAPGETATFLLTSPMAPTETRSFTNSPNHDTDESWVMAPGGTAIPAVSPQGLVGMAAAMLIGGALIFGRRRLKRLAA